MTEDVFRFIQPGEIDERTLAPALLRSTGWHLCDDDLCRIDELHALCLEWLMMAKNSLAARHVAKALAAFEDIAAGRRPTVLLELSVNRKPLLGTGLTVGLQFSNEEIVLSSIEWVWMPFDQGHDPAWQEHATLTARGGFDQEPFDQWFFFESTITGDDNAYLNTSDQLGDN